jgi:hypothetical protein
MESTNVDLRKFPVLGPGATSHPRWNKTPFESVTDRLRSNLEEKWKTITLFRLWVNALKGESNCSANIPASPLTIAPKRPKFTEKVKIVIHGKTQKYHDLIKSTE